MRYQLESIPSGDDGLRVKLRRLRSLVEAGRRDPAMIGLARRLVAQVPERDWSGEVRAVSAFVRKMRYTRDPSTVETFTAPAVLAGEILANRTAFGDCDDFVGLGAALYEALGHQTRFCVGGPGRGIWSHIWLEVQTPDGWRTVDDTNKGRPPGWSPASKFQHTLAEGEPMAPRNGYCYGGGCVRGTAGDLAGFSLKKIGKAIGKAIPKPLKKIAAPIVKPVAKVVRKVASPVYKNVIRKVMPIGSASTIVKAQRKISGALAQPVATVAGGVIGGPAGGAVGSMVGGFVSERFGIHRGENSGNAIGLPLAPMPTYSEPQPALPPMQAMPTMPLPNLPNEPPVMQQEDTGDSTTPVVLAVGAVLVLLLMRRR